MFQVIMRIGCLLYTRTLYIERLYLFNALIINNIQNKDREERS